MHEPSALPLRDGEVAVVSAGAVVDGYWAVESRTLGVTRSPQVKAALSAAGQLARGVQELAESGASLDQVFTAALSEMRQSGIAHLSPHGPCFSVGASIGESFGPGDPGARGRCASSRESTSLGKLHPDWPNALPEVSPAPAHDRIQLIPVGSLARAAPYFSQPFSVGHAKI